MKIKSSNESIFYQQTFWLANFLFLAIFLGLIFLDDCFCRARINNQRVIYQEDLIENINKTKPFFYWGSR